MKRDTGSFLGPLVNSETRHRGSEQPNLGKALRNNQIFLLLNLCCCCERMTVLLQRIPKYPLSVSHSVSSRSPRAHYNTVTQRTAPHPARKIGKVSVGQNYNVGRSAAWAVGSFHTSGTVPLDISVNKSSSAGPVINLLSDQSEHEFLNLRSPGRGCGCRSSPTEG